MQRQCHIFLFKNRNYSRCCYFCARPVLIWTVLLFTAGNFAELAQSKETLVTCQNHSLTYLFTYLLTYSLNLFEHRFVSVYTVVVLLSVCLCVDLNDTRLAARLCKEPFFHFYHPRSGVVLGYICLHVCLSVYIACLSLCLCNMITFESLDVESLLLVCEFIFRRYESISYKVIKSMPRSQQRKREIPYSLSVFNWQ